MNEPQKDRIMRIGRTRPPWWGHPQPQRDRVYSPEGSAPALNLSVGPEIPCCLRRERTALAKAVRRDYEAGRLGTLHRRDAKQGTARTDGCTNTLTTSPLENPVRTPLMASMRGRDPDNPLSRTKSCGKFRQFLEIADDPEICSTLTSVAKDSLVAEVETDKLIMEQQTQTEKDKRRYVPLPEELRGKDFRIRRLTPTECFRLMDVDDDKITLLTSAKYTDKKGREKQLISDSKLYQLAGNSIVVACMERIFDNLLFPPETGKPAQAALF